MDETRFDGMRLAFMLSRYFLLGSFALLVACSDSERRSRDDAGGGGVGGGGAASTPVCGNGAIEQGEDCDDGGPSAGCNGDCTTSVCGDGIRNATAGELCDDGNDAPDDRCDGCAPRAFVIDSGAWDALWPDVTVADDEGKEVFLVGYKRGDARDVVVQKYDTDAQPVGVTLDIDPNGGPGPVSIATSPNGGALIAWQIPGSGYGNIRYRAIDKGLWPVPGVGEWSESVGGNDPQVAAGADGGYCVAGFYTAVAVNCVNAQGEPVGHSSFPQTFGGVLYEGSHELIATGDGYTFSYVPDDESAALVGYTLDAHGDSTESFAVASWTDPVASWVPRWAGSASESGFVALAGLVTLTERHLYYRLFDAPGQPSSELLPVTDDPMVFEGLALRHASGRFVIAWLGDFVFDPSTQHRSCAVKAQRYAADGERVGESLTLFDGGDAGCPQGLRGAVDGAGDVFLTWMLVQVDETKGQKHGMLLPALLAD